MQTHYAYTPNGDADSPLVAWGCDNLLFTKDTYRAINIGYGKAEFYLNIYSINQTTQERKNIYTSKKISLYHNEYWDYSEIIRAVFKEFVNIVNYEIDEYPIFEPMFDVSWNERIYIDLNNGNLESDVVDIHGVFDLTAPVFFENNSSQIFGNESPWPLDLVDVYGGVYIWQDIFNWGTKQGIWECADSGGLMSNDTTELAAGSCNYEPETGIYDFYPAGRIAKVTITGNIAQNLNCENSPSTKKQMAQIRYMRADGFTIQRYAEVLEFTESIEQIEAKEIKRQIDYYNFAGPWNTEQVLKSNKKITLKWTGLPIAEKQRIIDGMINTPFVLIFVNDSVYAGIMIAEEKNIVDGEDLELSFSITNYKVLTIEHYY